MAITRNDYKYIHNTLPKREVERDDGTLKVGAAVKNLITPLNDATVYNPSFPEFYPEVEKDFEFEKWYPPCDLNYSEFIGTYEKTSSSIKINEKYWVNISDVLVDEEKDLDKYYFIILSDNVIGYEKHKMLNLFTYLLYTEQPNETVKYSLYKLKDKISLIGNGQNTIQYGTLNTTVKLKSNTTYVLQVVNAFKINNLPKNTIKNLYNYKEGELTFDDYLFFRTSSFSNQTLQLSINGLSFGYKILHKTNDNSEDIIQLRSYGASTPATVYLFESDLPWAVNDRGVICGMVDSQLQTHMQAKTEPYTGILSHNEIYNILSKSAPKIDILEDSSGGGLRVSMVVENETDKILLNNTLNKSSSDGKDGLNNGLNIRLFAARYYITPTTRKWNGRIYTVKYGNYRTFQSRWGERGEEQSLCFKVNPVKFNKVLDINDFTTTFTMEDISYEIDEKKTSEDSNSSSIILTPQTISLPIMSLASYNVDYENSTSYTGTKEEKGKYTSFVLFWGHYNGKYIIKDSQYSIPIIIERSFTNFDMVEDSGGSFIELEICNSWTYKRDAGHDYYKKEAIYITKDQ